MTGSTIVHDAGMIEHRARKTITDGMTDTTILIGLRMIICFTCGEYAIMTRLAVIHDAGMIKGPRYKTRGDMALTAIIAGWHMAGRLACGGITIVT